MRSFTSSRPSWSASRTRAGLGDVEVVVGARRPRHVDQPVEVGADPAVLGRLLARALEPAELASRPARGRRRACPASAILARYSSTTSSSPSSPSSLRIALICSRSRNSRWRFSMPSLTSVRILSFSSSSASVSLRPREHQLEPRLDVERSRAPRPSARSEVGRVAGGVGDLRRGRRCRAGTRRPAARRATRRCSRRRRGTRAPAPGRARWARRSSTGSTWTHSGLAGAGHADAHDGAREAADHERLDARTRLAELLDLGDRADAGVAAVDPAARAAATLVGPAAASAAACASSVSSVRVTTMPGSTTPVVRGSSGRTC